jgi:exodeoxyribonuclease V gamma subunit
MAAEIIMVQSKGMEHWVSLQLARRHGICANIRFPFPNRFVDEIHERIVGKDTHMSLFEPERLRWRIMRLLPQQTHRPEFSPIRSYLAGDTTGLRCYQLSEMIADTLDQYLLFRPELIYEWERGEGAHWQAELWRTLIRECPDNDHRAARVRSLLERLSACDEVSGLPERVCVFGIAALPRRHLDVMNAVARFAPVNLFLVNPCREYWGDIVSDREMARTTAREATVPDVSDLHLEKGNALLASTGAMGRDFLELIQDYPAEDHVLFVDPGEDSLLHAIQSDILSLRERGVDGTRMRLDPEDKSIRIHSCHSPLREVEVLHDHLLAMVDQDPGLLPGDILITAPDIEKYAPYIRAVFDASSNENEHIPYSITDQSARKESEIVDTFLALLDLGRDRFALTRVLAVLDSPSVMRRFGLAEADLSTLRTWASEAGVRWGLDGKDRARRNLPSFEENTWSSGFNRLLLGYAMTGRGEHLFSGILPYDHVEGADADLLERLAEFTSCLFELLPPLEQPKTPHAWSSELQELLDRFFSPNEEDEREALALRRAFLDLERAGDARGEGLDEPLQLDVIRWFLSRSMQRQGSGFGFMTGGVTFCSLLPMRSIPFRVICCLGMDSDAYPRTQPRPEFDLMALHPRPGDRSRRSDDRYLFLETLLSARSHLHISYVGQSQQDNTRTPPSVLVSELLDCIEQGFFITDHDIREWIVTHHPLQPFSPEYFREQGPLFTYAREHLDAATALVNPPCPPQPFFQNGLSQPRPEWFEVDLDDLVRFYRNPAAFLLTQRLGIRLPEEEGLPPDHESFDIEGLDRYHLGRELVQRRLKGEEIGSEAFERARSSGILPHGTVGRSRFQDLAREAEAFAQGVAPFLRGKTATPLDARLDLDEFRVKGRLDDLYAKGLVFHRFASIKPKDRLSAWVRHLFLCTVEPTALSCPETVLMGLEPQGPARGEGTAVRYIAPPEPLKKLQALLGFYREGLTLPLPFFPESSWAYAEGFLRKQLSPETALGHARRQWGGSERKAGESSNPYMGLCFRNRDPLTEKRFQKLALAVFGPLLEYEETIP